MAPDLELYYLSAQAHYVAHWATIFLNPGIPPPNINEREANAALHMMTKSPHTHHNSIDPTKVTVTAWAKLAGIYGKDSLYHPSMPIWGDPQSPFTLDGEVALLWSSKGISQWGRLFPKKTFVDWEDIRDIVGNTNKHKTQCMWVKAWVQRIFPSFPTEPVINMGLGYMFTGGIQKITAAALYKVIMQTCPMGKDLARDKWERDLGQPIEDHEWTQICELTKQMSCNARYRLIHYKIVHRTHYTPKRLKQIYPTLSGVCPRCKAEDANIYHMLWAYIKLDSYWAEVRSALDEMADLPVQWTPRLCLLGATGVMDPIWRKLLNISLLIAKRAILMKWKNPHPPTKEDWHNDMLWTNGTEELYIGLVSPTSKPRNIWVRYKQYLADKSVLENSGAEED